MFTEVRRVRESTDESVEKIEAEMQREQSQIEEEVLQKSVERSEALKAIKEEVEDLSAVADQEYRKSLDKDKLRHEEARKAILDMDNQRWRTVEEMDQSCQMWITAFNQRPGCRFSVDQVGSSRSISEECKVCLGCSVAEIPRAQVYRDLILNIP